MTSKILSFVFALVAMVFLVSAVSAFDLSQPSDMTLAKNYTSSTISQLSSELINVTFSLSTPQGFAMATPSQLTNFNGTSTLNLNISTLPSTLNLFQNYPFNLTATANNGTSTQNKSVFFNFMRTFCKNGATISGGNLTVSNVNIDTTGDENDVWKALDIITIEVEVKNQGQETVRDVQAEIGLYDSSGTNNLVGRLDFDSSDEEKIEIGSLGDGDRESATFTFQVPADFDTGSYKLVVKAYSDRVGESVECDDSASDLDSSDLYQQISVERQDDEGKFIAFDKVEVSPSEFTCGDSGSLRFDVLNVGDEDQARVNVKVFSKDLKISSSSEIKSSFDQGEKKSMTFPFTIPAGLTDKTYYIELSSEYDYRNSVYKLMSDEVYKVPIKVIGCAPVSTQIAAISASLASDAVAGKELIVTGTVRNLGTETKTFTVNAKNYDSWATLATVSGNTLTLGAGDSRDVTFKLNVNSNAEGSKTFTIEAVSGDQTSARDVAVTVSGNSSLFGNLNLGGSSLIWVIAAINVILVIVIIIVAVRVAQR